MDAMSGVGSLFCGESDNYLADKALEVMQDEEGLSLSRGFDPFERAIQVDRASSCELMIQVCFQYLGSLPLALKAIRMHDSWMNSASGYDLVADAPELVFARATAICHLACVMEGVDAPLETLASLATSLSVGLHGDEVSQEDVATEARTLVLSSNSAPSIACWISSFCGRFDVATHSKFAGQLQKLEYNACVMAWLFALDVPASPDQLPRKTALGSFMLALLIMRIVPLDALKPQWLRDEGWNWLLTRLRAKQHQGHASAFPQSLGLHIFVPVLECVTKTSLEEVCADAATVGCVCLE
mmetsp:Transcript_40496/g.79992  ORF Transcript_40496/g.79992 Transcript_40496/m.79992 type:complete len:299 (-) Transcript_40496:557-1453(-)